MKVTISGTSYKAALSDVEPLDVKAKGYGYQFTLPCPDRITLDGYVDRMAEAACAAADMEDYATAEAIYRDLGKIA